MNKKLTLLIGSLLTCAQLFSGNPLSLRIDLITGVWLDDVVNSDAKPTVAALPGMITDYGSSQAPFSMMGFVISDQLTDTSKKQTTSQMMVRVENGSLRAQNDGSAIDYTHENLDITVDQKIFMNNQEVLSRTIHTNGTFRISAGGIFSEPKGNLRFSLPACAERSDVVYDVALAGQVVPFSLPL